jgi:hypothetical protein
VDGLELPDLLRVLEAFGQNVDESCVEVVDAVAKTVQLGADHRDQDPDLGLDLLVGQCADLSPLTTASRQPFPTPDYSDVGSWPPWSTPA